MAELSANDRDAILRLVRKEMRAYPRDTWLSATEAAQYLKMSKVHFLKLCRRGAGPEGFGTSRLKRWKVSALDQWMHEKRTSVHHLPGAQQ